MSLPDHEREFPFTGADFAFLAAMVSRRTGITLGPHKRNLVYGRLARRLRMLRLSSFADYCALLQAPDGEAEIGFMVNAITTNMTSFFREPHHFEHLHKVLEARLSSRADGPRRVRLWSAGCSSGEEAYSMAMCLAAAAKGGLAGWDVRILATDIDTNMVATGAAGIYEEAKARSIPAAYRARFVVPAEGGRVAMSEAINSLVAFLPLNLLGVWPMRGPFDVIFCRNVVIYFDSPTKKRLFDRFADLLCPGGLLYIGHSETLFRICDRFESAGRTIYRKLE